MSLFDPLKIIIKGSALPGFVVNIESDTSFKTDDDVKIIPADIIPEIEESVKLISDQLTKDKK